MHCTSVLDPNLTYNLSYDKLVVGVGALSNTFGVPGVEEHACFLKVILANVKYNNTLMLAKLIIDEVGK